MITISKMKVGDLSINRYKEIIYEEVEYDDPKEILERIAKINKEKNDIYNQLKSTL